MQCQNDILECPYAQEIADLAVKKAFAIIGINIDEPHEVEEFRNTIRFSALAQKFTLHAAIITVGVLITTVLSHAGVFKYLF